MMPPSQRHAMVRPVHHLKRAVTAHTAIQEGIATHAQKEQARREAELDRKTAVDKLTPSKKVLRG
jgi:hypothetical protein